jgi:hypothetical protein
MGDMHADPAATDAVAGGLTIRQVKCMTEGTDDLGKVELLALTFVAGRFFQRIHLREYLRNLLIVV